LNLSAGSGNSSVLVSGYPGTFSYLNGVYSWYTTTNSKPAYRNATGYILSYNSSDTWWEIIAPDTSVEDNSLAGDVGYPWLASWLSGRIFTELPRTTVNAFRSIDAINKTATKGWVRVYAVDPTTGAEYCIAILAPDETLPQYRRYAIPGHEREDGANVTVLAKRKFIPVVTDDDDLIVTNLGALKMMAIAIEKEENNNLDEAMKYEEKAVALLREELAEVEGANIGRPQIQMEAFAMGEVPAMA
jgi:hypothetical protein